MYLRPRTVEDCCSALAEAPAAILSGGTDFFPALGDRPRPERILDLSAVADLAAIRIHDDHVAIGARATWSAIRDAALPPAFDALRAAAREVGSVQIQNVATLGGNLCNASPAADGVPPLLLLEAELELVSAGGVRQLPLPEFLLGNRCTARRPDEVLTRILVPRGPGTARSSFVKLGARRYLVISIVMAAALVEVAGGRVRSARVAVGACSAVARRLPELETALVGRDADGLARHVRPEHLFALTPISDVRASAAYRDQAALELVRRALDLCLEGAG
ncbi:FAD binding domain-containing protein [Enterovirga sp.]|uniref:FAD binding domain-containing protein n=1 Tax=Enterovirga sp. TaxID=2026350 RepID=UPI00262BC1F0|nr:FAD binding domain-containing protein [Enterovirga sp.]MDB5591748.1 xanthine dehydrogenase [Enterovirga sp.]